MYFKMVYETHFLKIYITMQKIYFSKIMYIISIYISLIIDFIYSIYMCIYLS